MQKNASIKAKTFHHTQNIHGVFVGYEQILFSQRNLSDLSHKLKLNGASTASVSKFNKIAYLLI